MNEIECPYCNAKTKIEQEGLYCAENIIHEIKCEHCEKNFVFNTEIVFNYYPRKADCVNGSPHQLTNWLTLWVIANSKKVQSRRCRNCEHREQRTLIHNKEENNEQAN